MKKATKVTLIFALIFFIVGIGLTVFGFYKNDWRTDNLMFKHESKTFTSEDVFNKIETNLHNSDVIVVKGDAFSVVYDESEKYPVTIAISDGVLRVTSEKKPGLKLFQWYTLKTTIIVPHELTDINIKTKNGNVKIEDFDLITEEYQGSIKAETTNGNITFENVETKDIALNTTNGNIFMEDINANNINISTTNGNIRLEDSYASSLSVKSTSGKIIASNILADIANLKTTNGNIDGVMTVRDLTARTTNGKIIFTIRGDKSKYTTMLKGMGQNESTTGSDSTYRIDCETSNGKCNVSFIDPTIE